MILSIVSILTVLNVKYITTHILLMKYFVSYCFCMQFQNAFIEMRCDVK